MIEKTCETCGIPDGASPIRDGDGNLIKCPGLRTQGAGCKEWVSEVKEVKIPNNESNRLP